MTPSIDMFKKERAQAAVDPQTGVKILRGMTVGGKPFAMLFKPKAIKPFANYSFPSKERREQFIQEKIKAVAEVQELKAKWKEGRQGTPEDLEAVKMGDIFHFSWGYDQTNVDYYQVTDKKGRHVFIRKIAARSVASSGGSSMSDMCEPVRDAFCGEPVKKLVQFSSKEPYLTMASYGWCSLWDGEPNYRSWYA